MSLAFEVREVQDIEHPTNDPVAADEMRANASARRGAAQERMRQHPVLERGADAA